MAIGPVMGAFLGNVAGGVLGRSSDKRESQRNRNFQQYNADTTHRREVRDLEAAGLNPILSATGGAPSPSGSQAPPAGNTAGDAISSALETKQLALAAQKQAEEINLLKSQKNNTDMDTKMKGKGLVRATVENEVYENMLQPLLNKIKGSNSTSVKDHLKKWPKDPSEQVKQKQLSIPRR